MMTSKEEAKAHRLLPKLTEELLAQLRILKHEEKHLNQRPLINFSNGIKRSLHQCHLEECYSNNNNKFYPSNVFARPMRIQLQWLT